MYYVEDGTKRCGYFECRKCGYRFIDIRTDEKIECPDCAADWDMEIGPDEEMQPAEATAERIRIIEGEEEVEKMDMLLSLAITGGDYSWI